MGEVAVPGGGRGVPPPLARSMGSCCLQPAHPQRKSLRLKRELSGPKKKHSKGNFSLPSGDPENFIRGLVPLPKVMAEADEGRGPLAGCQRVFRNAITEPMVALSLHPDNISRKHHLEDDFQIHQCTIHHFEDQIRYIKTTEGIKFK